MKIEIEISDDVVSQLDTAIQDYDAWAPTESMSPIGLSAEDWIRRETVRCVINFILAQDEHDLMLQADKIKKDKANRLNEALLSSLQKPK